MTTDTIKHLGAEFHHAADGVGEALQRRSRPCPICGHAIYSVHAGARIRCPGCEVLLEMVLEIVRPVENCGHVAADGTCGHPNALTPECHDGVVCPVKAEKPTLLDLTKLPPGTVCEAVSTVFSENLSRQMPTGTRFVIKEHASDGDALVESLDARQMWVRRLQPARVVKEGESSEQTTT